MLTDATALESINAAAHLLRRYTEEAEGRGVVIPAGGLRYFACAWVCIRMLRELRCTLPIELWHLGPEEMADTMRRLVEPLGVACVDASEVRRQHPVRILNGWELKPFAILNSRFREVLLLDADNVPVIDPTFLFETPPYVEHGAVFWPDFGRLPRDRRVWELAGVSYRDEPEFETGQILVDRRRCWQPLLLTMWLNEFSDFWYAHVHGDKETFHLAWRKLERPYGMPSTPIHALPDVMCQHDFSRRRLFQHRNLAKWVLDDENPRIPGFLHEDLCFGFLDDLREKWLDRPAAPYRETAANPAARQLARELCSSRWIYRRVGHDERPMSFYPRGRIAEGAASCERNWNIRADDEGERLVLGGRDGVTCTLRRDGTDRWVGRWEICERMEVELTRLPDRCPNAGGQ